VSSEDFTENKDWFDVKLLTDSRGSGNTIVLQDQNYAMKSIHEELSIFSKKKHYIHFGRNVGPIDLELQEIDQADIK
jgi:hypothetical protein